MTDAAWRAFLGEWSRELLASPDAPYFGLPEEAVASGWLGFEPASPEAIARCEARLAVALPPSYRAFLAASNGFSETGNDAGRIVGVDEVARFADALPGIVALWDRSPYAAWLAGALRLSDGSQGVYYLLDPSDVDADGECAAWRFGNEEPLRYASFVALLECERARAPVDGGGDDREALRSKLAALAVALRERARSYAAIDIYRRAAVALEATAVRIERLGDAGGDARAIVAGLRAIYDEACAGIEPRGRSPEQPAHLAVRGAVGAVLGIAG